VFPSFSVRRFGRAVSEATGIPEEVMWTGPGPLFITASIEIAVLSSQISALKIPGKVCKNTHFQYLSHVT
jgi:hypothetical protein